MKSAPDRDTIAITDLGAYKRNLEKIRNFTGPEVRLMAVVKANAYGHGMVECARTAHAAGASMFGVALAAEGEILRKAGLTGPVLVMAPESRDHWKTFLDNDLTMALTSFEMLEEIRTLLAGEETSLAVHIKVDTGMGRVGVAPEKALELAERAYDTPGIAVEGIFSHFPSADEDRDDYTRRQIDCFENLLDRLSQRGIRPPLAHMCNSAGTLKFPEAHFDLVRPGIMTYGLLPYPGSKEKLELEPVLSFYSRIGFIKEVPLQTPVSYGGTFVTGRPSRLATVPVGYADGYRRHLSNRGRALVNGIPVPVAGRICMDQTVFDITDAGDVRVGDTITLIGRDGDERITVEEHASLVGTISHEIVTGITSRVFRAFIEAT
ncbi:alanine racemase [bacterium]|nr:alanine racemase [bacterium]